MSYSLDNYMPQATFTITLGSIVENGFDIGLNDYPIFDEDYRETLNAKILSRYWFREIGQETPELFKRFLNRRMNEIMPYYNVLYKELQGGLDMTKNINMMTESTSTSQATSDRDNRHDETVNSSATAKTSTDSNGRTLNSSTPQMQLSGNDDYATALTDTNSVTSSDSSSSDSSGRRLQEIDKLSSTGTDSYVQKVQGLTGLTGAQAFAQLAQSLMNIDVMILEDLAPLFFGLYSNYMNVL